MKKSYRIIGLLKGQEQGAKDLCALCLKAFEEAGNEEASNLIKTLTFEYCSKVENEIKTEKKKNI